jgi:hypothetical protein
METSVGRGQTRETDRCYSNSIICWDLVTRLRGDLIEYIHTVHEQRLELRLFKKMLVEFLPCSKQLANMGS